MTYVRILCFRRLFPPFVYFVYIRPPRLRSTSLKYLFFKKFEVFFGFEYSVAIYKYQSVQGLQGLNADFSGISISMELLFRKLLGLHF